MLMNKHPLAVPGTEVPLVSEPAAVLGSTSQEQEAVTTQSKPQQIKRLAPWTTNLWASLSFCVAQSFDSRSTAPS